MLIRSRRDFLKTALGTFGAVGAMGRIGEMAALAANPTNPQVPYQALVCIFLAGGNDGHNMVFPVQTLQQNYSLYQQGRATLALPSPPAATTIYNGSDSYGLHPNMPEIASLYNNQKCVAIVANVGNLVKPITRSQYNSPGAVVPLQLFSHADQVNQWQSAIPDQPASTGWGGRAEDLMAGVNGNNFSPITSTSGCGLFCTGQNTFASTVPVGGASLLQGATTNVRLNAVNTLMQFDNGLSLVSAANAVYLRGVGFSKALNAAIASAKITTTFPNSMLGQQLLTVAKIVNIQKALGIERQVFFCQLGGFDTHSDELNGQGALLQQFSQAIAAFYTEMGNQAQQNNVTTFTASEFGRTLQPNGNGGTDHAWGSHHFVIGGGVQGGKFYGQYPSLKLGGSDDANSRGTLIPTTSIAQYAATLATWFGVDPGNLQTVCPNIGNFQMGNLGFLG
jgi:uncharacterized protein (DUF1501 family)